MSGGRPSPVSSSCWRRSRSTSRCASSRRWRSAAMIALVHDVVITAGIYALVGREVTPETVIAILTILGFSLYDTVVIYDKIKENTESNALVNTARLRGRRRPVAEPGADALGEHVAGRAAADPVAAAVRRRHAEGLRVRDVRGRGDRRVLVDLPGGAAARRCSRCGRSGTSRWRPAARPPASGRARRPPTSGRRRPPRPRPGPPTPRHGRPRRAPGRGLARRASGARRPSASGGRRDGHRPDQGPDPRRARLPGAGHRLQGHHARARRPDRVLHDHRPHRGALRPGQRRQGRGHRGPRVHHRLARRVSLRRRLRADPQAGQAPLARPSARTTSSSTARPRSSCTSTASTPESGC